MLITIRIKNVLTIKYLFKIVKKKRLDKYHIDYYDLFFAYFINSSVEVYILYRLLFAIYVLLELINNNI